MKNLNHVDCNDENCCQMQQNDNEKKCESSCGVKTTASPKCEQKISRPTTPVIPQSKKDDNNEHEQTSITKVYLEGTIPSNCDLLVLDTETKEEENSQCGIVMTSKVTLSFIEHDDNMFINGEKKGNIYRKTKKNKQEFENEDNKEVEVVEDEEEDDDEEYITAKQDKSRDELEEEDEEDADLRTENNPFTLSDPHYESKKKFDDEQNGNDSDEISNEIDDDDDDDILDNDNLIVKEDGFKSMKIENIGINKNNNKNIEEESDEE